MIQKLANGDVAPMLGGVAEILADLVVQRQFSILTSSMMADAVNCFVAEPISKTVSFVVLIFHSRLA